MSSQNAKKKRLGSRRVAPSQNEVPKADKYHLTETSSVAQDYAVEESTESLNVLSTWEDSKPETRHPPSAGVAFNRRKIGSNRRSKGKQLVNDLETEPYLNPGKELQEKSRGNETFETIKTPRAVELEQQEEFGQGSEHFSARAKDCSESTPDQNSEAKKNSSEGVMEILTPEINNQQECNPCEDKTKLEEIDISDMQSEEIKENVHRVAQQSSSDVPDEEPSTVYSVAEIQSTERDDKNLLRQDGRLQGSNLVNESHVEFEALEAVTPNITTDKNSTEQNIEVVCSAEQETFSPSKEKLTANEDPCSLSEVREAWQSEDAVNKMYMYENQYSSKIQHHFVTQENEEDIGADSKDSGVSLQSPTSLATPPFESQLQNNTVSTDKQTHAVTESRGNRRKMGSTRRNKGRQCDKEIKDEDAIGDETPETSEMSATETTRPEELLQGNECDVPLSVPHDSSMFTVSAPAYFPEVQNQTATSYPEISLGSLIPESESRQQNPDEQDFKVVSDKPLESGMEEVDESETALTEEVEDATHSEETVSKMHEEEVETTQIQDVLQNDFSSENVIDDATENSLMTSEDLDQTENSNTYQFQVIVQSPDESVTKVEVSTPDDKQAEHHFVTRENEEDIGADSKDSGVSLQSPTSLASPPFESQLQDNTVSTDQQTHAVAESRGHRRKMGSTRRNKARQRDKEIKDEDAIGDETPETSEMSATETTRPEELLQGNECDVPLSVPHDSSMFTVSAPAYFPEVQNQTATSYPEISLGSLIPEGESRQQNPDEQDFKVVSDKPLESGMEEVDESETALTEEVEDATHSEETVSKMHEEEVETTQIQDVLQNDFSSENVIDDATENSLMTSEDLDQTENSNTYQFQVMVQSPDESVTKVEVSTPDDKQAEHHFVTRENEEDIGADSKDSGVSLQSPTSLATPPFESQLQDNTVSTDKQTHAVTESRGHRRKMGSTRRNKARQRDKEIKDEDAIGDETPETSEMSATETTRPEELLQGNECDVPLSVPHDSSMFTVSAPAYFPEVQNQTATSYPEISLGSLIPEGESRQQNPDEQDFKVVSDKPLESGMEEVDESETALTEEVEDATHSEETVSKMHEEEVETTQIQDVLQNDFSSENVIDDATENSLMTSEDLDQTENSNTYQFQVMVQSPDESVTKVEVSTPDDKQAEHHFVTRENEEDIGADSKDSGVSLQSPTSLATPPFESQLQDNTVSTDKQTHAVTESRGHRRKMGSTRRNKARQRDKEIKDEDAIGDETPETTEMSATESTRPEELLQGNECDVPLSVPHDSSMFTVSAPAYFPEVQNQTATSYPEISLGSLIPEGESRQQNPDEQDFKVVSDKPLESGMEEVDESETALTEEVEDATHSEETVSKMHEDEVETTQIQDVLQNDFSSENVIDDATENSLMTSEDLDQTENSNTYQFQVMVQSPDESVTKVEVSTPDDKQAEHHFVTRENEEDIGADSKDSGVSLQSPTSLATPPFESQLQDNTVSTDKQTHAVTESRGHRRKMGSTRRNKARQRDKEIKDEDAIGDETPETSEMSATETTRPEELLQGNECDVPLSVPHDSSMFTVSAPAYFPEVQNQTATSYPEISLGSLIPEGESRQQNPDEQDFKVVSDKPLESGMEEVDESETALTEEVEDATHSEETVSKMHEEEVETTQIQDVLQNDFSSENVIDDATENSLMTSEDLDQTENSNTYQFQVMVQSPDESVTKVEVSTPDDKQAEHHFVTRENEEDIGADSKDSGVSLQSPTSLATPPFESQLQDNTVSTDKQTHAVTESRGHRRKMGSTRRNKARQRDKEIKDEDAIGDETPETTEMSATESTRPEELLQGNECDVPLSVPHDSSMFTVSAPAYFPEVQNQTATSYPEISLGSLIPEGESRQQNPDEQDFKVVSDKPLESGMEEVDESETALTEEVEDATHSEESVSKMHEDEVETTQIQDVLQNDFSSENVIDDATENSLMTSEDLDQTENSNTYQFQVMVQSPDESVTKVEVSTPDDKQAEHHFVTRENEEDIGADSKDSGVSLQSPTSLATPPFESQLQDNTVSTDKQTHAVTESRGHRRKMGSTRRNKARQRDKEIKDEDAIGDETPETSEMSATETTRPEELLQGNECDVPLSVPHDSSMFTVSAPAYFPEVQNQTATSYPEISLGSLIPEGESRQQNPDEQDFKVVSDKPLESGMEEVDESETALTEEVEDATHSEETVSKMHEEEVETTQIQDVLQNDFSSENVIDDATENSLMTSEDLDQTENSNTYQFQVIVQSPDESVTKVEVSTPDDKQAEHHFVTRENEEDIGADSKDSGVSLQSPTSLATPPFESQLQDNTVSTDKQTHAVTESRGNRRKMGSTRRNKGRQCDKEIKDEDAIGDETPETSEMSATETTRPEELLQGNECDVPLSVPHDSSMFTVSAPAYFPEVQNQTATSYPEISLGSLIPESESRQQNPDEQDFKVVSDKPLESGMEEVDESETALTEEVEDATHSEETVSKMHEEEVETTQIQDVLQNDFSSENVIDDATENSLMTSEDLDQTENSNTYQFQVMVQSPDESVTKVEVSTPDDKQAEHHFVTRENEEDIGADSKDSGVSLQSPTSLATPPFESQLQDNTVSTDKQTHAVTESRGHRRKMGSTRRNKARQRDKEIKDEDAIGDETPETTEMSATESTRPEELLQGNECDVPLSVPHDSSMFTVSAPAYFPEVQNQTATSYPEISLGSLIPESESRQQNPDEQDFKVVSDKPLESGMEEVDESETALTEEVEDATHSEETVSKMHEDEVETTQIQDVLQNDFSSENVIDDATENSLMTSEDLDQTENSNTYQFQVMEQSPDESVTKVEVSTPDDKQAEHHFVTRENEEDIGADSKDSGVSLQSPTSLATPPFESQLQDNTVSTDKQTHAVTESRGHRRKMGSTRRNKARQRDKEIKDEDAIGDETPETTEMSATETTRPEELLQGNECDVPLSVPHDSSMFTVSTPAFSPDIKSPTAKSHSEISLDRLIPESKNLNEDKNQTTFTLISDKLLESVMEEVGKSETALTEEVKDPHHPDGKQAEQHFVTQEIKQGDSPHTRDSGVSLQTQLSLATPPFESQLQNNTVSTDRQSHAVTETRGNRRKMGSTRRNKVRQRDKEFKDEDAIGDETPETTEMSATETTRPEELLQGHECDVPLSVPHDSSMFTVSAPAYSPDVQRPTGTSYSEISLDGFISKSENLKEDKSQTTFTVISNKPLESVMEEVIKFETALTEEVKNPHHPDGKQAVHHFVTQENNEGDASDSKDSGFFLQAPPSFSNHSFENQFQDNTMNTSEQMHNVFDRGSRRKMGSSRRNKGRNRDKEFNDEDTFGDEIPERAEMLATEATRPEELLQENKHDISLSVPYSENSLKNQNDRDTKLIYDKPVQATMEEVEKDQDTEPLAQDGNLPSNILLSGTTECTITVEITTEKTGPRESTEVECSAARETFLASQDVLTTNREQHEHCNPTEALMHQPDYSSNTESHQTPLSETNISLGFQHQDNSENSIEIHTGLSRTGNRKKMGSSRRNKGRQCVNDPDAYQEPKDDILGSRTVKMSPATDITKEEEAKDLISVEKEMQISSTAKEGKKKEKLLEEDASFLQNNMDSNTDVNEENKVVQEAMNLDQLTGCDTITKHLMQSPQASVCEVPSDVQHISYHGGIESSSSLKVLDEEEAFEAMDASNSQQEQTQSGNRNNLQINPKQKKRKIGSTRRSQLNRKKEEETDNTDETKESDFYTEADVRNIDKLDVGELPLTTDIPQNETAQPLFFAVHKQQEADETFSEPSSTEINVIPVVEDFKAPLSEQSSSLREEIITLVTCVNTGDVREVTVEPPQLDDFTNIETRITTVVAGRSRRSINQLLPPNAEAVTDTGIAEESLVSSSEARQNTHSNEERPESITVVQDQDANVKNPSDLNEGAHNKTQEMRSESPNLNLSNRRRKMGSTRRNLGSRNKEELHQKQEVDNKAKETGTDIGETECVPRIKEEALQLHTDHKDIDGEQGKQKVFETVEISPPGQSKFKHLPEQTVEERPVSQDQLAETEHHTANDLLSTSSKDDVVSESASGGRRRKLGSNRKSRGHQRIEDQTGESTIIDDQSGTDAKISEVGKSDKNPSSGLSKSEEHSKTVSEKTSAQPCNAGIFLGKENQTLSLVNNPGLADPKSKRYNVVMIGDSSVGKTSFMKRAQSGKFSLDIPASIGLDSLMWPVVVDGKPMILQLWDTAGQERFHSITKQVFHKAQAFLLMYDITSTNSFSAVSYWANCIQESAAENVTVLLLGNKSDCSERRVKTHQGEILAKEYDFEFMECSAATGENVIQSLEVVARKLSQRIDSREEATVLHKEPEQKKSSRCC